ncbi:MAG: radical SAM protein [Planctomycetota bacterium]
MRRSALTQNTCTKKWQKAVFIYPYRNEVPMYNFFPPIGLEYVATAASEIVEKIDIFDLRYQHSLPDMNHYDAVCISVNWRYEQSEAAKVVSSIPPHIFTVIGGRQATDNVEKYMNTFPNIDVVVCGDGADAVKELASGMPLEQVKGIVFRRENRLIKTEGRVHKNASCLQFPDRTLRRQKYYVEMGKINFGIPFDALMTSWGCLYKCKFCALRLDAFGKRRSWSARTPESVIEELRQISARWIGIIDENFFVDIKRAEKICDLIIENGLNNKVIGVQARIGISDYPKLLEKLWRAGFRALSIGIESAHNKTLKLLDKHITVEQVRRGMKVLRQFPFLINSYFIVGNIGETENEIMEILPFAREIGLDFLTLNILHFEEHSGLSELLSENPDYHIASNGYIYSDAVSTAELRRMRKSIDKAFYSPAHITHLVQKCINTSFIESNRLIGMIPAATYYAFSKLLGKTRTSRRRKLERLGKIPRLHEIR